MHDQEPNRKDDIAQQHNEHEANQYLVGADGRANATQVEVSDPAANTAAPSGNGRAGKERMSDKVPNITQNNGLTT